MVDRRTRTLFLAPAVIYLLVMTIYPTIYSLYLSTTRNNLARPNQQGFVGIDNYVNLLTNNLFQKAIQNTLVITIASVIIELVMGFLIARLFYAISGFRTSTIIRTIFILPMMLTPVVSGLLWTYILNPTLGVANYLLTSIGLEPYGWFAPGRSALLSIVLVNTWQWAPFLMLLMLAGLMSIPKELYEAAQLDGAGSFRIMRYLEIPSLKSVIIIGLIFRIIDNFRMFDVVYVSTRGGPGDATEIISMYAYREMFNFFNVGYGSAAAVIILIFSTIISNILYRFIRQES
ncbi:MAG: sugar ABC transporter permease [Anaerolineae bacterium]|nr:sugar ABC transporter permease [Anaerolineae bacterium]